MNVARTFSLVATVAVLLVGAPPNAGPLAAPVTEPTRTEALVAGQGDTRASQTDKDGQKAAEILANLAESYDHLDGVTVQMGETPNGEEAIAYYTEGRIVISANHSVDIQKILAHEVWHVIDWRDNGTLDWGEDLPPRNSSDYLR